MHLLAPGRPPREDIKMHGQVDLVVVYYLLQFSSSVSISQAFPLWLSKANNRDDRAMIDGDTMCACPSRCSLLITQYLAPPARWTLWSQPRLAVASRSGFAGGDFTCRSPQFHFPAKAQRVFTVPKPCLPDLAWDTPSGPMLPSSSKYCAVLRTE